MNKWVVQDLECIPLKYKILFKDLRSAQYLDSSFVTIMLYNCQNKYLIEFYILKTFVTYGYKLGKEKVTKMKKRLYDTSRGALNNVKMHIFEARYLLTLVMCRVDYCERTYMLRKIPDVETPKEAWENLKKNLRRQHDRSQPSSPARVEHHSVKGRVHVGLHCQDQEHFRLAWFHQYKRQDQVQLCLGQGC